MFLHILSHNQNILGMERSFWLLGLYLIVAINGIPQ